MIEKNDPRLTDFVLGELNDADAAEIRLAIAESSDLKLAVDEIQQTVSLLGAAYLAEEPLSLLDGQRAELELTREESVAVSVGHDSFAGKDSGSQSGGGSKPWLAIVLAASLVGLMIGANFYFRDPGVAPEMAAKSKRFEGMTDGQQATIKKKAAGVASKASAPGMERAAGAEVPSDNGGLELSLANLDSNLEAPKDAFDRPGLGAHPPGLAAHPPGLGAHPPGMGADVPQAGDTASIPFESGAESEGLDLNTLEAGAPGSVRGLARRSPFPNFNGGRRAAEADGAPNIVFPEADQQAIGGGEGGMGGGRGGGGMGNVGGNDGVFRFGSLAPGDDASSDDVEMIERGNAGENQPMMNMNAARQLSLQRGGAEQEEAKIFEDETRLRDGLNGQLAAESRLAFGQSQPGRAMAGSQALDRGKEMFHLANEGLALSKEMDEAPPVQLQPQGNASVPKNSAAGSGLENAEGGVASRGASKPIVNNTAAASDSIQLGSDDLESIEKLEQVIDELAHDLDPNMKREFQLSELVERTKEIEKLDRPESTGGFDKLDTTNRLKTLILANEGKDGKKFDDSEAYGRLEEALQKRNAQVRKAKSWKRVIAIPNTTRLLVGDKDELDLTGMQVNVQVDGFRARVLLDYFYYNDRAEQLEGNFKLRLPDDASLYYFAFGESAYDLTPKGGLAAEEFLGDGAQFVSLDAKQVREAREDRWRNVKESRMVPREKAAHAFRETVRRKVDPALVEWSGAGVFNARVFPMSPHKLHRIVIGYDVNLRKVDGQWVYELQLPENSGDCQVDLNVLPVENVEYSIEPKSDPFEEEVAGKKQRRYQFKSPNMKTIRLEANPASGESDAGASEKPPELMLHSADETEGEFWGVQLTPELPVAKLAGNPQAIFMLDTSLSSNPDKFNVWLKMLESTLTNNRESLQQFNVLFFNVDGHFWQPKWMDNTEANTNRLIEACNNLTLEGATDLYGAVEQVTNASWVRESADGSAEKPTSGPDLFLLSDGAANWGETNLRLIGGRLQDYQMGSLFAYQTGMTGTAISELRFLTGQTGGAVFSVASEAEIKLASTAHRKRPWKLASISAAGASDVMTAGRVQWVYPGQSITVVGRGTLAGSLELEFEQPGETKTMSFKPRRIESDLASRLYGQVAVGQLESLGSSVFDVAAAYSRHFRITGETCSLLMLDTEAEYERFDIKPQEDLFVIKTQLADAYVVKTLKKSAANLADPKAQLVAWLDRLETMPGMSFKLPTALKLALDDIRVVAVSKPLNCELATKDQVSKDYLDSILIERLDYEKIATEANRRGGSSVDEAVKVFSSLVERNPGDLVIARDVAYTALELGRPAQAYHLLRSVVKARPFEGSVYPALGQCLMQMGEADMAIVYYEVALGATFNRMGNDFKQIVSAEYMYLLRQVVDGRLESNVKEFAIARLETLKKTLKFESADVLISMMWNTDQTDVDLHIVEPNGEECSYENRRTRSGGNITSDITTGFGPEMYVNAEAPRGKYEIKVKYFANRQNRTELRNKVHLTIYRGFGTPAERVTRRTVLLKKVGEKESVATVGVD